MNMTLGQKQELFMRLLPRLLDFIHSREYAVRGGELLRDERVAEMNAITGKGIVNSLHREKLAIDLNLFHKGKFLTSSVDHKPFGEYWESLHPLCSWGGRFGDGNHYSITHGGRK